MPGLKSATRALFWIAALYDGVLGLAFCVAPLQTLTLVRIPATMHPGYIQFPAALLMVFALMFAAVAVHPLRNYNLIPYGILLKVAYCTVVLRYWLTTDIPYAWKPFCVADLLFLLLFWLAYRQLRLEARRAH